MKTENTTLNDQNDFDEDELESEVISSELRAESRKKYIPSSLTRSVEEYESMIESIEMITLHHKDGTPYQARLIKFKPEDNPLEHVRPVYVYASS